METNALLRKSIGSGSGCHRSIDCVYERLKSSIAETHLPTAEHSIRVRICALSLGLACNLNSKALTTLTIAAEIHDIGKLQVPAHILDKPCALSEEEWETVKQHSAWGASLAEAAFPTQPEIAQCVLYHHERLDGSGYPNGLRDTDIPILPRVIAVADAFISLTEDRPYRPAATDEEALYVLMREERGKYDQLVVNMLASSLHRR